MGYVDTLFTDAAGLITLMKSDSPQLMRVFVGIIDTIGVIGTDSGYKCVLQCRDRMRYLMETQVSLSPFDINNDRAYMNLALGGTNEAVNRSDTILRLAQLGVGHITIGKEAKKSETDINGMRINPGLIKDLGLSTFKPKTPGQISGQDLDMPPPDYLYNYDSRPLAGKVKTAKLDLLPHPKFNIITSRLPFSTESVAKEYTIEQQIPIELIKWLSNQETYPTEVFCSHQDGDYYYIPRSADISGLTDPKRFYRTYYYRFQPDGLGSSAAVKALADKYKDVAINTTWSKGKVTKTTTVEKTTTSDTKVIVETTTTKAVTDAFDDIIFKPTVAFNLQPDWAQGVINWREEQTTNAMYTNYLIGNNSPNNTASKANSGNIILMHMSARPPFLSGRSIAGRNMYVIDETITSRVEAIAVGAQMARIHSKETRSASMTLIGDPSMVPGEIVQVVGSPLHQELNKLETLVAERLGTIDYLKREALTYGDTLAKIKGEDTNNPDAEQVMMCNGANGINNPNKEFTGVPNTGVFTGSNLEPGNMGGSPNLLACIQYKGIGTIINSQLPPDAKLPKKGAPVVAESASGNSQTGTPAALPAATTGAPGITSNAEQDNMIYPLLKPVTVTSIYGWRTHPITGERRFHAGVDLGAGMGTPVVAALAGVVREAGRKGKYGTEITLDHGNNLSSVYGHLSQLKVTVGQSVATGQLIALSGNTGGSTGPHLHFELRNTSSNESLKPTFMNFEKGSAPTQAEIDARKSKANSTPVIASKTVAPPEAPKTPVTQVVPTATNASKPTAQIKNKVIVVNTKVADTFGLIYLTVTVYDSSGNIASTGTANSGLPGKQVFGTAQNDVAQSATPLPYGKYTIGQPKPGEGNPGIGSVFIPITSKTKLKRITSNTFGFHVDNDRVLKPGISKAQPGTHGSIGFITQGEFDKFKTALAQTGITEMEFVDVDPASAAVAPASTTVFSVPALPPTATTNDRIPTEFKGLTGPKYTDEEYKKSHFNQEPQSVWRVEAVKHQFNAAGGGGGYTIEVVLLSITG